MRIGFLINPIAGMGGRVGLKGTDNVADRAVELGAEPAAHVKARAALDELQRLLRRAQMPPDLQWLTCSGKMGADALAAAGFADFEIVHEAAGQSSAEDTAAAAKRFRDEAVDLILFCGGDGTARDICAVVGEDLPILGIPAGVKMYSGAFGISPEKAADLLFGFLQGELTTASVEVLDLDEERYRAGEWVVRLYHSARTPFEPSYTQAAKMVIAEASDEQVKADIAKTVAEEIAENPDALYLLGPGSTVRAVGDTMGIDKTMLGIDAVANGKLVGKDLNERGLLELLDRYAETKLVLSPIGAQGFVLGRGNLQLSPAVINRIGTRNIIVLATPAKLARTPVLRLQTGDAALDAALTEKGFIPVVDGYGHSRMVKVQR